MSDANKIRTSLGVSIVSRPTLGELFIVFMHSFKSARTPGLYKYLGLLSELLSMLELPPGRSVQSKGFTFQNSRTYAGCRRLVLWCAWRDSNPQPSDP